MLADLGLPALTPESAREAAASLLLVAEVLVQTAMETAHATT